MTLFVTKRNGEKEPIDLEKIHRVLTWAATGLDVSVSQVELKAQIQFHDGVKTSDIHETLIKTAADLTSADTPDYALYAGRLGMYHLRKRVYKGYTPPSLLEHITKLVGLGKYDAHLLQDYSKREIEQMDSFIDHDRDMTLAYAAFKQFEGKYLVKDRVSGEIYETPQFLNLLVGACLFSKYPKRERMEYIERFYHAVSTFKISLPTPIMAGVRTPTRQFSSCVLIEAGDSLDSINATSSSIIKYVSQRAGIGINAGAIRGLGSTIRGGEAFHTGVIPFLKHFQTAVKSCSQGGVRGGSATVFYPLWHIEAQSLLVLKNNRGVDENRVRQLDYAVQFNKTMYQRLIKGGNISLFSPSDVAGLYDAFFADQDEFERLYTMYEADPTIRRENVKAIDLFSAFMQERSSTGRIYLQNVDHCNTHGAFNPLLAPVKQSNLCMEIALPTKPLIHSHDENGEIALCTLSAFNLGAITSLDELGPLSDLVVRALDALLDYQDYPVIAAEKGAKTRRALGVGAINTAYYIAKNGMKYSDGSANKLIHETFEAIQYYLLTASNNLAKEKGACTAFTDTQYALGKLPIDTYRTKIDTFAPNVLKLDWDALRASILKHGLRNSTLSALMPSETSSQISNATNGIEPPRGLVAVKVSKDGVIKQVVPEIEKYRDNYELLWDMPDNTGYMQLVAIMQKFVDQSISANTNYDPKRFEGGKVPMRVLLKDLLNAYDWGLKTLYYHNTRDGQSDVETDHNLGNEKAISKDEFIEQEDTSCQGGSCKI